MTPASAQIRNSIATLARAAGARMLTRPAFPDRPDLGPGSPEPEPLAGARAALSLEREARAACCRFITSARGDGETWSVIGTALGYAWDERTRISPAVQAFTYAACDLGNGPVVPWTCQACRKTVFDRGPEAGGPADAEPGHAEGCERLAEAIRVWDEEWADGQ